MSSGKRGCHCALSDDNLLWQFIPLRAYSNAERILATSGGTPLLVSLKRSPGRVGNKESGIPWAVDTLGFFVSRATLSSALNRAFRKSSGL